MEINNNTQPLKALPSVLAFRRGVIITDALLEQGMADGTVIPVAVIRHGVMGTQNVNESGKKTDKKGNTAPNDETITVADGERDVRNLQVIESAKTGPDMVDLRIGFEIKALPLKDALHSCANSQKVNGSDAEKLRAMLDDFIKRAQDSEGLQEVSRRIARNICNGRWLWRNRLLASAVRIEIAADSWTGVVPDALDIPLREFGPYSETENVLGAILASGFRGEKKVAVKVGAILDMGVTGSIEVYGSQNYEPDTGRGKSKGDLSRSLYKLPLSAPSTHDEGVRVVGQAAFRDAKIWNALRTIDTWYPEYAQGDMPIPVEPQGASLSLMRFFRAKDNKKASVFDLFKRLHQINPDSSEGQYCLASLMRGGVFGGSEKNRDKEAVAEGEAEGDAS